MIIEVCIDLCLILAFYHPVSRLTWNDFGTESADVVKQLCTPIGNHLLWTLCMRKGGYKISSQRLTVGASTAMRLIGKA